MPKRARFENIDAPLEAINAEDCINIDGVLRTKNIIFHGDCKRKAIWIFNHPGESAPPEFPDEDTKKTLGEYVFELFIQGSFKASELAQNGSIRSLASVSAPPPSAPATQNAALRAAQLTNMKPPQSSSPGASQDIAAFPQPWDTRALYTFFSAAIDALIAYHLGKSGRFWPLDDRNFYMEHEREEPIVDSRDSKPRLPASIVTYSLYLTFSGTLIVSYTSCSSAKLVRLSRSLFEPRTVLGKTVTQFPNGKHIRLSETVATPPRKAGSIVYLSPGGLEATLERDCPSLLPVNSNKDNPLTQTWKSLVREFLLTKGIFLDELENSIEWTGVKVTASEGTEQKSILWPRALCFCRRDDLFGDSSSRDDLVRPAHWFRQSTDGGYKDPLRAVEEWILTQPDRDKIREERKRRKEQEAVQRAADLQPTDALSPFNARGPYADSQAVAGVYPTPPDGILSQTSVPPGTSDMMATSGGPGTQGTVMDANGVSGMNSNSVANDAQTTSANGDDLFEGPDYDDMAGNDITDADFSFFDRDDEAGDQKQDSVTETIETRNDAQDAVLIKQSPDVEQGVDSKPSEDQAEEHVVKHSPVPDANDTSATDLADTESADVIDKVGLRKALSPHAVQERLFGHNDEDTSMADSKSSRRRSDYAPLEFNDTLKQSDTKYGKRGVFGDMSEPPASLKRKRTASIDITSPPVTKKHQISQSQNPTPQTRVRWEDDRFDAGGTPSDESDVDDGLSSAIATDVTSPQTASSDLSRTQKQQSPDKKENRLVPFSMRHLAEAMKNSASLDAPRKPTALPALARKNLSVILIATFESKHGPPRPKPRKTLPQPSQPSRSPAASPAVVSSPASPAPAAAAEQRRLKPTDKSYIKIAQIIAEQIIYSTTSSSDRDPVGFDLAHSTQRCPNSEPLEAFRAAIKGAFAEAQVCDLMKYASIKDPGREPDQGQFNKSQSKPLLRRTTGNAGQVGDDSPPAVVNFRTPHIRVRRNDGLLEALPPAMAFWETLGLAPTNGPKNVMSYSFLPGNQGLKPQLMAFMDYLGATYEGCKLGSNFRGECKDGIIYVNPQKESYALDDMVAHYRTTFTKFGKLLAETNAAKGIRAKEGHESTPVDTFVIYVFNPFDDPNGVKELCVAFWLMYQAYSSAPVSTSAEGPRPDIVLQILPISCIGSSSLVIPETRTMQKLAREVYDRCPPAVPNEDKSRLRIYSGPSLQLEEAIPKGISFKLIAEPPSDLFHEPSHIHVGYARSASWVTAAWTDNTGRYQATASYCLIGTRTFFEVAREIWQTTIEIMQARKVAWRISIARAGIPEREELDAWAAQASAPSAFQIITFLVLVDPNPPIPLFPKNLPISTAQTGPTKTPVGTPQSGISPDTNQVGTPAATPSEIIQETLTNDPDAHLIDITDETYGVILGHRVNVSPSITECRPSISSGFLIRPNVAATASPHTDEYTEDNAKSTMEYVAVHLLWIWTSQRNTNTPNPSPTSSQSAASSQPSASTIPLAQAIPQIQSSLSNPASLSSLSDNNIPPPSPATAVGQAAAQQGGSPNVLPKSATETLLRETMVTYRNLAALARCRGVRPARAGGECSPWHLRVAMRGVEGLEGVMGL